MTRKTEPAGKKTAWAGILTAALPGAALVVAGVLIAKPYILKALDLVLKMVVRR
ncbi:MAG: hypothetical protein IKD50_02770 [Clostridia bacterium]|jgi:hypothetical protein|nr:hypothetical protein [Clostridia bacterium]MBR7173336.1 hypothetical protein [Clostridia bacterium]